MFENMPLVPEQASTLAGEVDALFLFITVVSVFFTALIFSLVLFFSIKYRRRTPTDRPKAIEGSLVLEITWSVIPFAITMVMFVWSAIVYARLRYEPADSMQVYVVGKQWMWKIQHMEGQREINELHVPVGRPVKLTMTSEDVLHSFFIPAFRIKQDAVPGRYTTAWFEATKPGKYHIFCAEYCGTAHSGMIGSVYVMEPAAYEEWLNSGSVAGPSGKPVVSLATAGGQAFEQLGCKACHRADAGALGPNLEGVAGHEVQLASGEKVMADDAYLRESILEPGLKLVAGFQPVMPTFKGLVSEEQLAQLIAYIKSLGAKAPSGAEKAAVLQEQPVTTAMVREE